MDDRIRRSIRPVYNHVRGYLPSKIVVCNGVPVRQGRLFDLDDVTPDFKPVAMRTLRRQVGADDDVLVIGGGYGAGAVVAARRVLAGSGSVTVYEASAEHCDHVRATAEMNRVAEQIGVEHALVGEAVEVWGDTADVTVVSPEGLPEVDVLYVDVEGAELSILDRLGVRPRLLIVEYHPEKGISRNEIADAMTNLGYEVVDTDPASPEVVGTHE